VHVFFAVLRLVYSVACYVIGWEECLWNDDIFCVE